MVEGEPQGSSTDAYNNGVINLFSETLYFVFLMLKEPESSVNMPALRQFNASCETTTTLLRKDEEFIETVMPLI